MNLARHTSKLALFSQTLRRRRGCDLSSMWQRVACAIHQVCKRHAARQRWKGSTRTRKIGWVPLRITILKPAPLFLLMERCGGTARFAASCRTSPKSPRSTLVGCSIHSRKHAQARATMDVLLSYEGGRGVRQRHQPRYALDGCTDEVSTLGGTLTHAFTEMIAE